MLSEGRRAYRYDDNGSLVKESLGLESIGYRYDEERWLVEALAEEPSLWGRCHSNGMTGVAYAYDALGRRVSREESFSLLMGRGDEDAGADSGVGASARSASWLAGEGRERSLYDGLGFDELVVFSDPVDKPGFGWRGKRETVALYFRAKGELVSSTEYYQKKNGRFQPVPGRWDTAYYVSDALGSVVAALDTSGHVAETWRYDAFGAAYEGRFGGAYRYGYAGKAFDNVTGAYNYGFRDYDPGVGRFTSVDPIRDGNNWYVYCASDPVLYQ